MITETLAARAAASARMIGKACTIALLMAALIGPAVANNGNGNGNGNGGNGNGNGGNGNGNGGNGDNPTVTAPEIDPGSAVAALALMSCGTLILTDRRGR